MRMAQPNAVRRGAAREVAAREGREDMRLLFRAVEGAIVTYLREPVQGLFRAEKTLNGF